MAGLPPSGRTLPPGGRPSGIVDSAAAKRASSNQSEPPRSQVHALKPSPVQPGAVAKPGGTTALGGPKVATEQAANGKLATTPGKLDHSKFMVALPGAGAPMGGVTPALLRGSTATGTVHATLPPGGVRTSTNVTSPTPSLPASIKSGPPSSEKDSKTTVQPIKLPALGEAAPVGHSRTPSDIASVKLKPTPTPDKEKGGLANKAPGGTTSGVNIVPPTPALPSSSPTSPAEAPPMPVSSPPVGRVPIAQRFLNANVMIEPPRRMTTTQAPRPAPAPMMAPRPHLEGKDGKDGKDSEALPNETKEEKRERMRKKVAVELKDTEESYVTSLEQLDTVYIEALRALVGTAGAVVSAAEAHTLFSNISQIRELNRKFLADLKQRIDSWSAATCVCDLVRDFAPYFKMYTQYVSNYSTASDLLQQLEKRAAFVAFIAEKQAAGHAALSFYLIMPIQRIPRYKLLLQEIQKMTADNHDDKKACDEALVVVSAVALRINDEVKLYESRQKIMEIQSNFTGNVDFVSPSRRFIRQGQLTKICRATTKVYTFFCFNDLLVYADASLVQKVSLGPTVKRYKLHRQIPIDSSFGIQDMVDDVKFHNRFTIINAQKSFVVYAPSKEEKAQWFKDLSGCMSEFRRATGTKHSTEKASAKHIAPVWQTDSSAKQCQCCRTAFSLIKRRHHCRYCGNLVCEQCSTKRMKVNTKKEPLRVCDHCVAQIKGEALPKPVLPDKASVTDAERETSKTSAFGEVESDDEMETDHMTEGGVKAVALHAFEAMEPNDLAFNQGDVIWVTSQKDPGWWEGTLNGKSGVFPANYVAIEGAGPGDVSVPIDTKMVCKEAYTAQNSTELSMNVGDAIQCTAKENTDEWLFGTNSRTAAEGWFPGSCVTDA